MSEPAKKTDPSLNDGAPSPAPVTMASAQAERAANSKRAAAAAEAAAKPTRHLFKAITSTPDLARSETGAALLVAHMLVDLGTEKAHKLSPADAILYADRWRKDHPSAWPAVRLGDFIKFVNFLGMAKIEHDTVEGYQAAVAKIAPPLRQEGF